MRGVRIHRIKITLLDMPVPVWRAVEVAADTTLADLYGVVQKAMGWELGYHLHVFETPKGRFGEPDPESEILDAARVTLDDVAPRFAYIYDFGDNCRHDIVVEETFAADPGTRYPRLTGGAGACPPEDCGGAYGYPLLLEALADPSHEEHEHYMEWTDGGHDPAAFDVEAADRGLRDPELTGIDEWLTDERIPKALRAKASGIVSATDAFCLDHLDIGFAELCRKAAAALARKRPSPLARGDLSIWAAGIVYAMGRVNFLGDGTNPLHMSAYEISTLLDVKRTTMQNKASRVLEILEIETFDPEFAHPGLGAHPLGEAAELLRLLSGPEPEPIPLEDLLDSMIDAVPEELLDDPDPLQPEMFFSEMMGAWWGQELVDADVDEVFCGGLIERAAGRRTPQALAILRALAVLAPPPFDGRASASAGELSAAGVPDPVWADTIGRVRAGECWSYHDIYGDQRSIFCGFAYGGAEHTLCVLVDDSLGRIVKDAYIADQPDLLLSEVKAQQSRDPATVFEPVDPAIARALLETAFADTTDSAPVSEDFASGRALALSRVRALPAGGVLEPSPVHDDEARQRLVDAFLEDNPGLPPGIVRGIIDYGCDHDLGRPLRVSPAKLDHLTLIPALSSIGDVLPAWTRWAAARQDLPEPARKALAEIADEQAELLRI
ncbi:DUF6398 domain-containing protein [Actinomadura sp. 7K507]|uniref:IS1096 element passenger TnpR family protein n=1 Tax=Actinomadura sp. 7K507 TaxID=2530365 RepID=UPI001A9D0F0E|nr:DUF6398 domain-containing protein [Actinomadura sp. 7K507]